MGKGKGDIFLIYSIEEEIRRNYNIASSNKMYPSTWSLMRHGGFYTMYKVGSFQATYLACHSQ
ncbi:MAG: hypothetical protein ACFFCY_03265 [Promethearchaeota archaeon]